MYVFNGTGGVKKENKVWGPKQKQLNVTLQKKTVPYLTFDQLHAQ
jgi:hypothetical protein